MLSNKEPKHSIKTLIDDEVKFYLKYFDIKI